MWVGVPFQQEGLRLDLQKDFQIAIKGIGHRLGACEQRGTKVWNSLGQGVSRGPNHKHVKPAWTGQPQAPWRKGLQKKGRGNEGHCGYTGSRIQTKVLLVF